MANIEEKTHAMLYSCFTYAFPNGENDILGEKFSSRFRTVPFNVDKDFMDMMINLSLREGSRYVLENKRFPLLIRAYALKNFDPIAIRIDNQSYQLF